MKTRAIALFALALLAGACSRGAALETPAGFATLGGGGRYAYRATNARGVVLTTRAEPNDVRANTAFWAETIDARLKGSGYEAEAPRAVKTSRGLEGTQLRYTTTRDGRAHRYWVTVFATASRVFVVEAAGDSEPFDKAEAEVNAAISTLDAS